MRRQRSSPAGPGNCFSPCARARMVARQGSGTGSATLHRCRSPTRRPCDVVRGTALQKHPTSRQSFTKHKSPLQIACCSRWSLELRAAWVLRQSSHHLGIATQKHLGVLRCRMLRQTLSRSGEIMPTIARSMQDHETVLQSPAETTVSAPSGKPPRPHR